MTPMPNITKFCEDCHKLSDSKGWLEPRRTDAQYVNLMISENSEALEDFRAGRGVNEIYYQHEEGGVTVTIDADKVPEETRLKLKPCGIPIEIADTIIRIAQYCGTDELDLEGAMDNASVVDRKDVNEALADATAYLSDAWRSSHQYSQVHGDREAFTFALASAMLTLLNFCTKNEIDIWRWVEVKNAYNATRPQRHGGKKI